MGEGKGWNCSVLVLLVFSALSVSLAAQSTNPASRPLASPVRVADAVCAKCHQEIFQKYLSTPMANASGLAVDKAIPGKFQHANSGVDYGVTSKDGEVWLHYVRREEPRLEGKQQLLYFLGSGHLGVTYLYELGGYLLESPVAYYANSQSYDMKPGLTNVRSMPPALPVTRGCMRCHMSAVQREVTGSRSRFSGLPFLHGGITCESCHGETAQHVTSGGKTAVLNPLKLAPQQRDSICINCHLEGETRVERSGRSVDDFKPGDNISDFISYFVYDREGHSSRGVSEIEQFSQSRCKRMSGERMSCMNCHDPHYSPKPAEQPAYYRQKCLSCHAQPKYASAHHSENPDCTSCHMPKGKAQNVPHVAWTDHRIRREPDRPELLDRTPAPSGLVSFLSGEASPRDLALAYYNVVIDGNTLERDRAWRMLEAAQKANPQDAPVLSALGYMSQLSGNTAKAVEFYRESLKLDPNDLIAENNLAILLARSGNLPEARDIWRKVFAVNEDVDGPGINLSLVECRLGNKDGAMDVLRRVLVYSPDRQIARERLAAIESGQEKCAAPAAK